MLKLRWGPHERRVDSAHALEAALVEADDFARATAALLVTIEAASGATLSIGLGADRTVVNYVGPTLAPPYFTSVGGESDEPIAFLFGGTLSEYPGRNAIGNAQGRAAAQEFRVLGDRPRGVEWEEI